MEPIRGHRLKRRLGQGAFGEVWSASAPDGSTVALKFIDCQGKPGSLIAQEIRMMRSLHDLRHANFIQLHSVCSSPPYIIITMERADGSLRDLQAIYQQESGKNIPAGHLLELLEQAARALDFLAELRLDGVSMAAGAVQHCDIKPSNLLVMGDCLKVADFGLCATAQPMGDRGFRGTPGYAAPELYEGRTTSRTDQFALAVTYCDLCLGNRVVINRNEDLSRYPGLPIDLSRVRDREYPVLIRALSERWTDRWPSCQEFIAALKVAGQASRRVTRGQARPLPKSAPGIAVQSSEASRV
jgi:serine/threonine protein kinase